MGESCPYCGEEPLNLPNHVRLSRGDGHGDSGVYPDDFNARVDENQQIDNENSSTPVKFPPADTEGENVEPDSDYDEDRDDEQATPNTDSPPVDCPECNGELLTMAEFQSDIREVARTGTDREKRALRNVAEHINARGGAERVCQNVLACGYFAQ